MSVATVLKKAFRPFRVAFRPAFSGTWEDRLDGIFDAGVDFRGKSVLDAGCNMGVIVYEISKQKPASIHGVDRYRRAITVARRIFLAIKTPSRFDAADFFNHRRFVSLLQPHYDVVLLMAVWQHVYRADKTKAERFLAALAERSSVIVFRGSEEWTEHFSTAVARHGFTIQHQVARPSNKAGPLTTFARVAA